MPQAMRRPLLAMVAVVEDLPRNTRGASATHHQDSRYNQKKKSADSAGQFAGPGEPASGEVGENCRKQKRRAAEGLQGKPCAKQLYRAGAVVGYDLFSLPIGSIMYAARLLTI